VTGSQDAVSDSVAIRFSGRERRRHNVNPITPGDRS
jgi:hypothetical protein